KIIRGRVSSGATRPCKHRREIDLRSRGAPMNAPTPIPLRADPAAVHEHNVKVLARACIVEALSKTTGRSVSAGKIIRKTCPHDEIAGLINRASASPTTLTSASGVAQTTTADLIAATGPISAGVALLQASFSTVVWQRCLCLRATVQATANSVSFV